MPSIYGQATVTILASRAQGVHEGFLGGRIPIVDTKIQTIERPVELPFKDPEGKLGNITLLSFIQHYLEPLEERAWALQEQFLSTRILDYGSLSTSWTCPQSRKYKMVDDFTRRQDLTLKPMTYGIIRQWTDLPLDLDIPLQDESSDTPVESLEKFSSQDGMA